MQQYIKISTSSSGELFGIVIHRNVLIASVVAFVAVLMFGVWGMFGMLQTGQFSYALKQSEHALNQSRVARNVEMQMLQSKLHAEQEKQAVYARALGQLQARMARLDTLGTRLVHVAVLD